MKKQIKQIALILVLGIMPSVLMAQTKKAPATGSSFMLLEDADQGFIGHCSANGEYVTITFSEGAAAIWKKSTNEYIKLFDDETSVIANDVNDSGIVVGAFSDQLLVAGETKTVSTAGYWKAGKWTALPYPDGYEIKREDLGSTAYGISYDCRTIVGMIYLPDSKGDVYTGCVWVDGKFDRYYTLPWDESMGGRPNGIAGDGKSSPGWADKTINDIQYAHRAPVLFGAGDTVLPISSEVRCIGEMFALNYDGSKGVGSLPGGPFLWDKSTGDLKYLGFLLPAHEEGVAVDLSEGNTVVGYTYEMMPDSRRAFIWKEEIGIMNLATYASEVYGLELEGNEFLQAVAISADGRIIYGNTLAWTPFILVLDGEKLPTAPNTVVATPLAEGKSAQVSWRRPVDNGMKLMGYNVYRDEVKINGEMLLKEVFTYTDLEPNPGKHCYAVTAVFDLTESELESKLSKPSCIQVLGGGKCYSVKTTSSTLQYNQIYTVNWALPSAYFPENVIKVTPPVQMKAERADAHIRKLPALGPQNTQDEALALAPQKSYKDTPDTAKNFDFVSRIPLATTGESAIASLGNNIYGASWIAAAIYKYDLHGNYIEMFAPSCGMIDALTTDGTYLYAVNGKQQIYKIDVNTKMVIDSIAISQKATHVCYIPTLDNNMGGFEYGIDTIGFLCKKDGAFIETAFSNAVAVSGTAYYNGFIYAMEQSGYTEFKAQINQYSIETKKFTGLTIDLQDYSQLSKIEMAYGGGITLGQSIDGALCLSAVLQDPEGNSIISLELEKPAGLTGYNVYRNGQKIASNYPYRNYQQILNEAGDYEYYVTAQWGDCESDTSSHQMVSIQPKGECAPPRNLEAYSTFNHIDITWAAPQESSTQTFVGYILYDGNGKKLNNDFITTNRYTAIVEGEGIYKYSVEAFYTSSCEARTEPVTVDVAFVGECLPVSNIKGQYNNKEGIDLTWDAPYFDHPIAMRYDDGVFADAIGMKEGGEFMAAIGWYKRDMTLYKDFVMVGMEVFIAAIPRSISLLVIVDDVIVVEQNIKTANLVQGQFNYIALENPVKFEANVDFAVGFRVDNMPEEYPLGIDKGPAKIGYSDLISSNDGKSWESIYYGNWLMAAAITKYRDITPATTVLNGKKVSSFANLDVTTKTSEKLGRTTLPIIVQSKAETFKLKGYNVYKADTKLNEALLTTTAFNDKNVSAGESLTYQVSSVWETCDELKTVFTIKCTGVEEDANTVFTIYPNPTNSFINIETTTNIDRIRLFDMTGKEIFQQNNANRIDVSNFKTGLYLLKVETNGKIYTKKINILK